MGGAKMGVETLRDCLAESLISGEEKGAIAFLRDGIMETEISYAGLDQDSNRMANVFTDYGVKKGDRVVLYLNKSLGLVVAYLALQKLGAVAVPLNPGLKRPEMHYLLKDTEPKLILSGPEQHEIVREIDPKIDTIVIHTQRPYQGLDFFRSASDVFLPEEISSQDPGLIIYTSGTTGEPKGAVLTQKNLLHDARNIINVWGITESEVICHALPLFHVHGLCFALHTALVAGAGIVMLDRFSPRHVLAVLSKREAKSICTLFMGVPAMYRKMMDHVGEKDRDFEHIRLWTCGSAPLPVTDFEEIKSVLGKEPVEREGMSETGMNFSNPLHGVRRPGSIGLPMPDLQVRIVDPETHEDVDPGQTGEIWLKGPAVTPGYWRKPKETARAFENGWFRTGDLGLVDGDGYYHLIDRIKHIIISGGENISPKEVEAVIDRYDDVVESCVVGVPDKRWGEKVVAAIAARPGSHVKPQDIQRHCMRNLHNWKCPKEVIILKELPKNIMGKVLKEEIRALMSKIN